MSFVAKGTRRIPVAPEAAFDRLADFASWPTWMPSSFRPAGRPEGTLRRGQKIYVRIAGIPVASRMEVTEVRRPKELAWSGLLAPFVRRLVQRQAERIGGQQLEALARSLA